jgi:hypothetical protein
MVTDYCANSPRREEFPIGLDLLFLPAINKTLFFPSNADFDQISSVLARYVQLRDPHTAETWNYGVLPNRDF